ncbi:hypothetical protein Fcan01_08257 [Folsomia candida]|uniref:Protein ABHD18 n=1 Tax=Folsomia candida TaxID=158441 RepID=A0A226EKY6_FOLCA|nr:hypothetical protein Fcan01_08257 [Folsomia candida]
MASLVDQVYRSFVISKFFSRGWGSPEQLKRLFDFRKNIANRDTCMKLVDPNHRIIIDKVQLDESGECKLIDGHFRSDHLPGLLPPCAEDAYFQLVVPADGWKSGDHHFWRRRNLIARPLLKDHGISSLILENPFYGVRKPPEQFRSSLLNVSDIFVMGGSLILEGIAILNWCEREGFGPNVMHGISMGGHMASLAAVTYNKPVCLVPCLSWSTASGVFTQGVMSGAIDWKSLETQFFSNSFFKDELYKIVWSNSDEAYLAGKEFVSQFDPKSSNSDNQAFSSLTMGQSARDQEKNLFYTLTKFLKERGLLKILPDLSTMTTSRTSEVMTETTTVSGREHKIIDFSSMITGNSKAKVQKEAIQFMRGVMDEFTHLKNFSKPVDPSLIIVIAARDDAYVPRDGYQPLDHIWPGCHVRFLDGGHVSAYVLHQKLFKQTIAESVARYREKYNTDGTLKAGSVKSVNFPSETDKKVIEVLGFQNAKSVNDSSQRM